MELLSWRKTNTFGQTKWNTINSDCDCVHMNEKYCLYSFRLASFVVLLESSMISDIATIEDTEINFIKYY